VKVKDKGAFRPDSCGPQRVLLAVTLALATLTPPDWNLFWGVNLSGYWPPVLRLGLLLGGLVLIWQSPRLAGIDRSHAKAWRPPDKVSLIIVGVVLLGIWTLWPTRSFLFGDTFDFPERFLSGHPDTRSLLYEFLVGLLCRATHAASAADVLQVMQALSIGLGVLFLILLGVYCIRHFRDYGLHSAAVLLGGYVWLFQAYPETYALYVLVLAGYFVSLEAGQSTRSKILVAVHQIVLLAVHPSAVLLAPVTAWFCFGMGSNRKRMTRVVVGGILSLVAILLVSFAALADGSQLSGVPSFLTQLLSDIKGVLSPHEPWIPAGWVFSWRHLVDIVNGLMISVGPAIVFLISLALFRKTRALLPPLLLSPLGAATLLLLLGRLLIFTHQGAVLDWDLYSAFYLPFVFLALKAWHAPSIRGLRPAMALPMLIVALILSIPLAGVLRNPDLGERYLQSYVDGTPAPLPWIGAFAQRQIAYYHMTHHLEGDAELFWRAYEIYPRRSYARRAGLSWILGSQWDKAHRALTAAIEEIPLDRESLYYRGVTLFMKGSMSEADEDLARVEALIAGDPEKLELYARTLRLRGDIALRRSDNRAWHGFFERYLTVMDELLAAGNTSLSLLEGRAEVFHYLDRHQEAVADLQRALQIDPNRVSLWRLLGECYLSLQRPVEAQSAFTQGLSLNPKDHLLLRGLGRSYQVGGDLDAAIVNFSRSLDLAGDSQCRLWRAETYLEQGRVAEATQDIEMVLRQDPENPLAQELLERAGR
jgi:tetratricopeptide (TPR) repeat protein